MRHVEHGSVQSSPVAWLHGAGRGSCEVVEGQTDVPWPEALGNYYDVIAFPCAVESRLWRRGE